MKSIAAILIFGICFSLNTFSQANRCEIDTFKLFDDYIDYLFINEPVDEDKYLLTSLNSNSEAVDSCYVFVYENCEGIAMDGKYISILTNYSFVENLDSGIWTELFFTETHRLYIQITFLVREKSNGVIQNKWYLTYNVKLIRDIYKFKLIKCRKFA